MRFLALQLQVVLAGAITCTCIGPASADLLEVRSFDGSGNNVDSPTFGQANTQLLRMLPANYPDGIGETISVAPARPNPRVISNTVSAQGTVSIFNNRGMSDFVWQWGQFVDHDIDLTESDLGNGSFPIPTPPLSDPFNGTPIAFDRSNFDSGTSVPGTPREQINQISAYIDASNVYGSDATRAAALRAGGGLGAKLDTSAGGLLPPVDSGEFFVGDVRGNEQLGLTSMHTLFIREHNRLVDLLAIQKPGATDEELYQTARKIVGAQMQVITYSEFLPALVGDAAPVAGDFSYDNTLNAQIHNEFSTAAYRFGHSMLARDLQLANNDLTPNGSIALRDAFFNPSFLMADPSRVDQLLAGLATQEAQEVDALLVDDVRNFLFGLPPGGFDLGALNLQRGRDHGLEDYNSVRVAYGLAAKASFLDPGDGSGITTDPVLAAAMSAVYGADINNVDAWIGGLAEEHTFGSVGELVGAALIDQFTSLRDGDRFFYLNDPDLSHPDVLAVVGIVGDTTLHDVIVNNTAIDHTRLQNNVFFFYAVPEPSSFGLAALALLSLGFVGWRRRRR